MTYAHIEVKFHEGRTIWLLDDEEIDPSTYPNLPSISNWFKYVPKGLIKCDIYNQGE